MSDTASQLHARAHRIAHAPPRHPYDPEYQKLPRKIEVDAATLMALIELYQTVAWYYGDGWALNDPIIPKLEETQRLLSTGGSSDVE